MNRELDREFHEAWQLQRAGRYDAAAAAFDTLLRRRDLRARRADVLFWSGAAHEHAGRPNEAVERWRELVARHPQAWHAADARRRLADLADLAETDGQDSPEPGNP